MFLPKRIITAAIVTVCILTTTTLSVHAASHVTGCQSKSTRVVCGSNIPHSIPEQYHTLYNTPNGSVVCTIQSIVKNHDIYCSNSKCAVLLNSNVGRLCIKVHQYCPDETGLCQ